MKTVVIKVNAFGIPVCPKCGNDTSPSRNGMELGVARSYCPKPRIEGLCEDAKGLGGHMHAKCCVCGYVWLEECFESMPVVEMPAESDKLPSPIAIILWIVCAFTCLVATMYTAMTLWPDL